MRDRLHALMTGALLAWALLALVPAAEAPPWAIIPAALVGLVYVFRVLRAWVYEESHNAAVQALPAEITKLRRQFHEQSVDLDGPHADEVE